RVLTIDTDRAHSTVRRIRQFGAGTIFGGEERCIVVACGASDRVDIRAICLDDDAAGALAAAGTPSDLGQQLKGALSGAEVRQRQRHGGPHPPTQRHPRKVVPLAPHRGAAQSLPLPPRAPSYPRLDLRTAGNVTIEPRYPSRWETCGDAVGDPLGANALA